MPGGNFSGIAMSEHPRLINKRNRAILAVLLAPAFAAIPMIIAELVADDWNPSLESAVGYTAFTYAFALLPTAVFVLVLKWFSLRSAWHYAVAGLATAAVCAAAFASIGPGGSLEVFFEFAAVFLPTGVVVGLLVWVLAESEHFGAV